MVKNDALFSYVAPGNIFAWALMPLRYCMPLRQFVWLNRTVIKATHFPLLFCIFVYEKYFLAPYIYEATDLVEQPGRGRHHSASIGDPSSRSAFFSPSVRVREESVLGFQKDRALEEVFRRAPDFATLRTQRRNERRKTQNAIRTWMDQNEGGFNTPHRYSTIDSRITADWHRRLSMNRDRPSRIPRQYSDLRSAASDPADLVSDAPYRAAPDLYQDGILRRDYATERKENTDQEGDGDDELVTNDEDEEDNATNNMMDDARDDPTNLTEEDYFTTPVAGRFSANEFSALVSPRRGLQQRRSTLHTRTLSTNTILYAPEEAPQAYSSSSASMEPANHPLSRRHTPISTPISAGGNGIRSPRRSLYMASRPRSFAQPREMARTVPNRAVPLTLDIPARQSQIRQHQHHGNPRSSDDLDLESEAETGDDNLSGVPSSFAAQMAMASAMLSKSAQGDNNRMSRLMLAKMKTLEESLGDVVREMSLLRNSVPNTAYNSDDGSGNAGIPFKKKSLKGGGGGMLIGPPPGSSTEETTSTSAPGDVRLMGRMEVVGRSRGRNANLNMDGNGGGTSRRTPLSGRWMSPKERTVPTAWLGTENSGGLGEGLGGNNVKGKGKEKEVLSPRRGEKRDSNAREGPTGKTSPEGGTAGGEEGGQGFGTFGKMGSSL